MEKRKFVYSGSLDEKLSAHSGQMVKIIRTLGPDEADLEVGEMFEVEADDGEHFHVFDDELNRRTE